MKTLKTFLFVLLLLTFAAPSFAQNIERMFQAEVKVYLSQYGGTPPTGPGDSLVRPVLRDVPNDFKLRYALDAVFEQVLPDEEQEAGYYSPANGLVFEGVSLRNGTATVRFSQPAGENYELYNSIAFVDAITKTAKQFRSVRRVRICGVGKTTVTDNLDRPFPRCVGR